MVQVFKPDSGSKFTQTNKSNNAGRHWKSIVCTLKLLAGPWHGCSRHRSIMLTRTAPKHGAAVSTDQEAPWALPPHSAG